MRGINIKEHKISRIKLYRKLANKSHLIWKSSWKRQKLGAEYLKNQDVRNIYSILENVSEKYKIDNVKDFYVTRFNTRIAIIF